MVAEIQKYFEPVQKVGQGQNGIILLSKRKEDQKLFAVKGVSKSNFNYKHVAFLKRLSHKNISKIYGLYYTKKSVYMLLSYYQFSLADWIRKPSQQLPSIPILVKSLLEALQHIHSQGILHRDIKPENIMFKKVGTTYEPVIIDFDLA